MATLITTEKTVNHMEIDNLDSAKLLYSEGSALKNTNESMAWTVAGDVSEYGYVEGECISARFNTIYGFTQINASTVILADTFNCCLRIVDRHSFLTEQFAGTCENWGYRDGQDTLFKLPHSVLKNARTNNSLFVTDHGKSALRVVNVLTRMTSTLISIGLYNPTGLAFDPLQQKLLISNSYYITALDLDTNSSINIAGSGGPGFSDGSLSKARFNNPDELTYLTHQIIAVAEGANNRLKVVDRKNNVVTSICDGYSKTTDGSTLVCSLSRPTSLLLLNGTLYIGQEGAIRMIECK
jgi:hypothetical protein